MVKFSFEESSEPTLVSILDLLPELRQIGDEIEFKKENFAGNSHSAFLIFTSQSPVYLAEENAKSTLSSAGWRTLFKDPRLTNIFTKGHFSLQLETQTDGQEGTSITCTISEGKRDLAPAATK